MGTKLYWIDGPWLGRLALAARPRGGDWLDDELAAWRAAGVNVVVSLLMPDEDVDLQLVDEGVTADRLGLRFRSIPIVDRDVPESWQKFSRQVDWVLSDLSEGRNVVVHCRQGVGRAGLVASSLLMLEGLDSEHAVEQVSSGRGLVVPETEEQRRWLDSFANTLEPVLR